jgi:hypothetical protein
MDDSSEQVHAVIRALESPRYQWRTIRGIAEETNIPAETILEIISEHSDIIIRSSIPSLKGDDLYTTRRHYRGKASIIEKIRGAFKNRID